MKAVMAVVLLALLVGRAGAVALPTATVGNGLGVVTHWENTSLWYTSEEKQFDMIQASGVKFVKNDLIWGNIEGQVGNYDFSYFDTFSAAMAARGIRILWTLNGNNGLYGTDPTSTTWLNGFANFAAQAVSHFSGHNNIYELWNEPNTTSTWPTGSPNANQYMAMVNKAVTAMRAADSSCTIVGPAIGIDNSFLTTCINYGHTHLGRKGLLDLVDAVSVHPYRSSNPETAVDDYTTMKGLMTTYGGKTLPIVSTEWGYSTGAVNAWFSPVATAQQQGDYIARMMLVNLSQGIPLSIAYDWKDDASPPYDPTQYEQSFGMTTLGDGKKPSYMEMQLLTTSLKGTSFSTKLSDGNSADWLLVFTTPSGHKTLAAWTTGDSHTITDATWGTLMLSSTPIYINPAPEPGTFVLLVAGLVGMLVCAWKKGKRIGDY